MNELMKWAGLQEHAMQFTADKLNRVQEPNETTPDFWKTSSTNKLLTLRFPQELGIDSPLNAAHTTVLGGMCLLTTIDMKKMSKKEMTFDNVSQFKDWFQSWYPRIDQIHDTVGTPPNICKKVVYVSEDSFFADRISNYTGLDKNDVQSVLRDTHETQGHTTLKRYLKNQGFKGEVEVVYTSDIDRELDVALKIWERTLGTHFRGGDRNFAKVELMYTGFWLDILNLQNPSVIFEAANKFILKGWLGLEDWFKNQKYGTGVNKNLGIAGYLPFMTTKGDSSVLSYSEVPNFNNYKNHTIPDEDMPWYIANMLYMKKTVVNGGPSAISNEDAGNMIKSDLKQYYED